MRGKGFLFFENYNLVYARVPKAANTSIKETLARLLQRENIEDSTGLTPTNADKIIANECRSKSFQRLGYTSTMSFEQFAMHTTSIDLDKMDVHTQPQTFLIEDSRGRLPKFVGITEQSEAHWNILHGFLERLEIPIAKDLIHLHSSANKSAAISRHLSEETLGRIRLIYGRDIVLHQKISQAGKPLVSGYA